MVNFTCQLEWAKRCPDSWWNISKCVCEGVSRGHEDLNQYTKSRSLWLVWWTYVDLLRVWIEQKGRVRKHWLFLLELGHPSSPALRQQHFWGSLSLDQNLHYWPFPNFQTRPYLYWDDPLVLRLLAGTELHHWLAWSPGLQTSFLELSFHKHRSQFT